MATETSSPWLDLEIPAGADPDTLQQRSRDSLAEDVPGYESVQSDFTDVLLGLIADMAADREAQIIDVARAAFREYGKSIPRVLPDEAQPAVAATTWTMRDDAGYTIPAGVQVAIGDTGFELVENLIIDNGDTTGTATLQAILPGADGNYLTDTPVLIDSITAVDSIALDSATSGGTDDDTDEEYEVRLANRLQHWGRPVLPDDFSARALDVAGVGRALPIDGYDPTINSLTYDPDDPGTWEERTITVAIADDLGEAVSAPVKTAVVTMLEAEREQNFVVKVIDPTYTTVDVSATISVYDGFDAAAVAVEAAAAVTSYLSPAMWGSPPFGDQPAWNYEPLVRRSELFTILNEVRGVRHVETLTLAPARSVTAVASTDLFTSTAHGYAAGDPVVFSDLTGGTGVTPGATYYVIASGLTANDFKVSATLGGSTIDVTTNLTVGKVRSFSTNDVTLAGIAPLPRPGTKIEATAV